MSDHSRWRSLEKDFRELQVAHPELYAEETVINGEWTVRGNGRERFESLVGIGAIESGHATGNRNHWLNLVKPFLLDRNSEQITCIQIGSASGVGKTGEAFAPDSPLVTRRYLCTIRPVCQASADYCLERAKLDKETVPTEGPPGTPVAVQRTSSAAPQISSGGRYTSRFPHRAAWLAARLRERSWNRNDPLRYNGPDPKTIDKILEGRAVREDVLEKLVSALSAKIATVTVLDIPQD